MLKRITTITLILISISSNSASLAQENYCADKQNDYELNVCLGQLERSNDKELNKVYQQVLKEDSINKKELVKAELAWIKWRDAECKIQSLSYKGGSKENQEYSMWFIKLTKERVQHLKALLNKIA